MKIQMEILSRAVNTIGRKNENAKNKNNNNRKKNAFNWMINKLNKPKELSGKDIGKLTKIVIKNSPNL